MRPNRTAPRILAAALATAALLARAHALDRFFAACAAHQDACGFGGDMPEDAYDALVARMNRTPTPAPNATHPDPVRGDDVLEVSADSMYSVYHWSTLARALREAEAGDASRCRRSASTAARSATPRPRPRCW